MFLSPAKSPNYLATALCGLICFSFLSPLYGVAAANRTPPTPAVQDDLASVKVKLYYLREATKVVALLKIIADDKTSRLHGMDFGNVTDDEIILYGTKIQRDEARRIIATMDLPRPGINMQMWGIQISSRKPDDMAEVMRQVRNEVDRTQDAVRRMYEQLQRLAREQIKDNALDDKFTNILQTTLGYNSALDANRPLSLSDILLRIIAAKDAGDAASKVANGLNDFLAGREYKSFVDAFRNGGRVASAEQRHQCKARRNTPAPLTGVSNRQPFHRFFEYRGLEYTNGKWRAEGNLPTEAAQRSKMAVLEFALQYGQLVHHPENMEPYYLQQSAEALNTRLQASVDALNLDVQELFVEPTLDRIRDIVGQFCDVEYAQVGRTTVSSLSGVPTEVTSTSVNAFDVTPPLKLTELLTKAKTITDSATPFVPHAATQNLVGAMPLAQVIGLIGALGEERSVWRELKSGVSLKITPAVLRNMTSAELQVLLQTGDPQGANREQGVRPLSRVSQHDVTTKVYVNAMDFFDLSAFASQSTLNGGRGYVPIIGPTWRGIFGEVPGVGNFFSWKKNPQNVYSQSLVLTTSFISPTSMGLAVLYPTKIDDTGESFATQRQAVDNYKRELFAAARE
jgi:hypothetical protein